MKILLLHPEDEPEKGPWSSLRWGRIVDIGVAGKIAYSRWEERFRCPIDSLNSLRQGFSDFRRIRDLLTRGCGHLVDRHGLDWWEILSMLLSDDLDPLFLLERLRQTISPDDEVYLSRPCLHADILSILLPRRPHIFSSGREGQRRGIAHYLRVSNRLSAPQIIDVFWDKFDAGYQLRGRFSRRKNRLSSSVVLLPSAYVNVSRTAIAYANLLPEQNFLLVSTRNSGSIRDLPSNVAATGLSSYASLANRSGDIEDLEHKYLALWRELIVVPEFQILERLGSMKAFTRRFRQALEIRDAWLNVLDREPVEAVFSADDSNPYTRIPVLLARERQLPTLACHHGALDGQNIYKRTHAGVVLAKGEMEKDYLVRNCKVPAEVVEIGAPAISSSTNSGDRRKSRSSPKHILFISEPSEVTGGRSQEIYSDILPALADLAMKNDRKLIVKLHPAESKSERAKIIDHLLSREQKQIVQIVDGPLTEGLLGEAWFGITILSTVATECAMRGIPCFLCRWLEFSFYGYVEQFIRFGAGIELNQPDDIAKIPRYLEHLSFDTNVLKNCWQAITAERFAQLLTSPPHSGEAQTELSEINVPQIKTSVAS